MKKEILGFLKVLAVQAGATAAAVCLLAFLMLKQEWSAQTARIGVTAAWGMISFLGACWQAWGEKKKKISAGSGLRLPVCSGSSLHLPGRRKGDGPAAGPAGPLPGCLRRRGMAGGMCAGIR